MGLRLGRRTLFVFLTAALALASLTSVFQGLARPLTTITVDDMPTFRGDAGRNGEMTGPGPTAESGHLWRVGDALTTAPVSDGNTIYVGTEAGDVVAVDAESGEERWRWSIGFPVAAAPAVVDGVV